MMAVATKRLVFGLLCVGGTGVALGAEQPSIMLGSCPGVASLALYGLPFYGYPYRLGYTPYRIPYYALHPPVYYSYPVPRTYGYSPFAYPPGTMTPEVAPPEPVMIQNKFVPKPEATKTKQDRVAQAPLRIANPFARAIEADGANQGGDVAAQAPRGPQRIFPASSDQHAPPKTL